MKYLFIVISEAICNVPAFRFLYFDILSNDLCKFEKFSGKHNEICYFLLWSKFQSFGCMLTFIMLHCCTQFNVPLWCTLRVPYLRQWCVSHWFDLMLCRVLFLWRGEVFQFSQFLRVTKRYVMATCFHVVYIQLKSYYLHSSGNISCSIYVGLDGFMIFYVLTCMWWKLGKWIFTCTIMTNTSHCSSWSPFCSFVLVFITYLIFLLFTVQPETLISKWFSVVWYFAAFGKIERNE